MQAEPHILACVQKISEAERLSLFAEMLECFVLMNGTAETCRRFPSIGAVWCDPPQWKPYD